MPKPLVAVLDACVLYPAVSRDTILLAAEAGAYQFRWTDEILSELRRNLVKERAAPEDRVDKMLADLAQFFADGRVSGHERHIATLRNDPKDRHVVAAAIEGDAELVVTENLKDFPSAAMPEGIRAASADEFLSELLERSPGAMIDAVWSQATRKKRPPISVRRVLAAIARAAPGFAAAARPLLGIRSDEQLIAVVQRLDRALAPARTKPGTADPEELNAAWADACVVSPRMAEATEREARRLVPLAVRVLAQGLTSSSADQHAETAQELRAWGIDPDVVDVAKLTDDQILALVDRIQATSQ